MLTGNPPHTGASAQQIIMKIVTEDAAPVTRLRKAVPPNVSAAVAKSLEKIPADRFESAKAFADALVNPTFATRSVANDLIGAPERPWSRDPRSIGVAVDLTEPAKAVRQLRTRTETTGLFWNRPYAAARS